MEILPEIFWKQANLSVPQISTHESVILFDKELHGFKT